MTADPNTIPEDPKDGEQNDAGEDKPEVEEGEGGEKSE